MQHQGLYTGNRKYRLGYIPFKGVFGPLDYVDEIQLHMATEFFWQKHWHQTYPGNLNQ